jgi:transposase
MQRLQAFKFELMPDGAQQRDMRRFSGACRFVYNKALAEGQGGEDVKWKVWSVSFVLIWQVPTITLRFKRPAAVVSLKWTE